MYIQFPPIFIYIPYTLHKIVDNSTLESKKNQTQYIYTFCRTVDNRKDPIMALHILYTYYTKHIYDGKKY